MVKPGALWRPEEKLGRSRPLQNRNSGPLGDDGPPWTNLAPRER